MEPRIRVNLTVREHVPDRGEDDVFDGDGFDPAAPEGDPLYLTLR